MVRMSRTGGMRFSFTGSSVSKQAASAGSAEFFAPLIAISPSSGRPPSIRNLSMLGLQRLRYSPAGRSQLGLRGSFIDRLAGHQNGRLHVAPGGAQEFPGAIVTDF